MSRAMLYLVVAANLGFALSGCASDGSGEAMVVDRTGGKPTVVARQDDDLAMIEREMDRGGEAYRGPLIAALVTGSGPNADINRRMAATLAGTGVFATVLPVSAVGDAHEAEVIILPTAISKGGGDSVEVHVKTWRKGSGQSSAEQVYKGQRGGGNDALTNAMTAMSQDLARRYGARASL